VILYVSDTLGSKRNGGVSLSGVDFAQMLRLHYEDVTVLASDKFPRSAASASSYGGMSIKAINASWRLSKRYQLRPTLRSVARFLLVKMKNIGAKRRLPLADFYSDETPNFLFVNSWSSLYPSPEIVDDDRFKKICVVRGNPESFVWQSVSEDKEAQVKNAAEYLHQFDALIFVSSVGLERWRSYLKEGVHCYYLPNSIDEDVVGKLLVKNSQDLRASLGFAPGEAHFVAVGSVQTRKGQDMLVDAALKLRALGYTQFKIHIVGVVSELWGGREILNRIKASSVAQHFCFYGHRNDALAFMRAADICLFPSRAEAFPRTVAEYMALEKPIVSTDVSGVPEMIQDGENGLLCAADNGESMGEKVALLLEDTARARKFAKRAREAYAENFSKDAQAYRAIKLFRQLDADLKT
jgi:glycosyltransferase involved in cell wall biosynthesis